MAQAISHTLGERTALVERLGVLLEKYKSLLLRGDYVGIHSLYRVLHVNPDDKTFIQEIVLPNVEAFRQIILSAELYQTREGSKKAILEVVGVLEKIVDPGVQ